MKPDLKAHSVRDLLGTDSARILEIGANDGSDTVEFLANFPTGRIDCFECDPRAIDIWRRRIPSNHPRASLTEAALGETPGVMKFHQSGGDPPGEGMERYANWDKSGSLLAPDRHTDYSPWLKFPGTIDVRVTTLDEWRGADESIVDFCWVDAQGAEGLILRGGQKTIRAVRWWYCEVHKNPYYHGQATLKEIQDLLPGFALHSEHDGENYLFRNTKIR